MLVSQLKAAGTVDVATFGQPVLTRVGPIVCRAWIEHRSELPRWKKLLGRIVFGKKLFTRIHLAVDPAATAYNPDRPPVYGLHHRSAN